MTELQGNKVKIYNPINIWKHIFASLIIISFSIAFTFFIGIEQNLSMNFITGVFFITLALGLIVSLTPYRNLYELVFMECIMLFLLFFLCLSLLPPIVKTYRLDEAAKIIPPYKNLQVDKIEYLPGSWPDNAPTVVYLYRSSAPSDDYEKIHDFYKDYLTQRGWIIDWDFVPTAKNTYPSIMFSKIGSSFANITISDQEEDPTNKTIRVDIN